MNNSLDKQQTNKRKKMIALIAAVLICVGAVGFAVAKYVSNNIKEAEIHASNFHFSSNYLQYDEGDNSTPEYTVSDWGDRNVQFLLYNYEQENVALISETDILYKITVSEDWSVTVEDAAGKVVAPDQDGAYTMVASTVATSHKVTLSYNGEGEPTSVSATVRAISPYQKTLEADFALSTKEGIEYDVVDKGDYNVITLQTNNYYGPVSITWNADNHSPDNTCDYMGTWRDGTPGKLNVLEFNTYTFIFVENTAGNYSEAAFTIKMGE